MKTCLNVLLTTLTLSLLVPARGQDATQPKARTQSPIQLRLQGNAPNYLGQNSGGYAAIGDTAVDYYFYTNEAYLRNGASFKISLNGPGVPGAFLYETSKGNAGFYDTAADDASTWTIIKQKNLSGNNDDVIHWGDIIQLRNGYWTDNFLCDYGNGYAASGSYNRPRNWLIEFARPKPVVSNDVVPMTDTINDVVFFSNLGLPASQGAQESYTLSSSDEVGVRNNTTNHWDASLKVGARYGSDASPAAISVEASAAIGQVLEDEKTNVHNSQQAKSVTINFDKPADADCFVVAPILVPYLSQQVSYGDTSLQMRHFAGQLQLGNQVMIVIPRRSGDTVIPWSLQNDIEPVLKLLANKNADSAQEVRNRYLPGWLKNGWVVDGNAPVAAATPVKPAVMVAPPPVSGGVVQQTSPPPVIPLPPAGGGNVRQATPVRPAVAVTAGGGIVRQAAPPGRPGAPILHPSSPPPVAMSKKHREEEEREREEHKGKDEHEEKKGKSDHHDGKDEKKGRSEHHDDKDEKKGKKKRDD